MSAEASVSATDVSSSLASSALDKAVRIASSRGLRGRFVSAIQAGEKAEAPINGLTRRLFT